MIINNFKKITGVFKSSTNLKAGIWYTISNFLLKGINFFTIPVFTTLLTVEEYGVINTYTAWIAVMSCIICLNLNYCIANAKYDFKEEFDEFINATLIFSIIVFIIIFIITNLVSIKSNSLVVINLILLQSFGMYVLNYKNTENNMKDKYKNFIFLSFISTLTNIIFSIFLMVTFYDTNRAIGRLVGGTVTSIILAVVIIFFTLKNKPCKLKKEYIKYALKISIPVIPFTLSAIILNQFDRVIVQKYCGAAEVGIYSFIYNIGMILTILSASLNNAWKPYIFKKLNEEKYDKITKDSAILLFIYTFFSIMFLFISPELQYFLGRNKFNQGSGLMVLLVVASFFIFAYNLVVFIEFYFKKIRISTLATICLGILNIVLNVIFVPRYGYIAAGYTTFVCYSIMFIWHYMYIKSFFKNSFLKIRTVLICLILLTIGCGIFKLTEHLLVVRYGIIFVSLILALLIVMKVRIKNEGKLKETNI